jgi:hypothetical protein
MLVDYPLAGGTAEDSVDQSRAGEISAAHRHDPRPEGSEGHVVRGLIRDENHGGQAERAAELSQMRQVGCGWGKQDHVGARRGTLYGCFAERERAEEGSVARHEII